MAVNAWANIGQTAMDRADRAHAWWEQHRRDLATDKPLRDHRPARTTYAAAIANRCGMCGMGEYTDAPNRPCGRCGWYPGYPHERTAA